MGKLAIISEETVRKIVTRQLAFDAVRAAFEAVAVDRSRVFDVVIGTGLRNGEAFAIKSGIDGEKKGSASSAAHTGPVISIKACLPMVRRSCCSIPRPDFHKF